MLHGHKEERGQCTGGGELKKGEFLRHKAIRRKGGLTFTDIIQKINKTQGKQRRCFEPRRKRKGLPGREKQEPLLGEVRLEVVGKRPHLGGGNDKVHAFCQSTGT